MSSPDINLLALLSKRESMHRSGEAIKKDSLMLAETNVIVNDMEAYFDTFPKDEAINWLKFRTFFRVIRHADWKVEKHELYEDILERVEAAVTAGVDESVLDFFGRIKAANEIDAHIRKVLLGEEASLLPVIEIVERVEKAATARIDVTSLYGPTDLSTILDKRLRAGGVEWRLDCMNKSAGPLRGGDLVIVAARPEAGKTSLICSEFTHMAPQLDADKDAVIFNPEEAGGRLFMRLVTAALGKDIVTLASDEKRTKEEYEKLMLRMDRIRVVEPAGGISTEIIERVLDTGKFGLVAINVLGKLRLSHRMSRRDQTEASEYASLAYWMREAATKYNVPIVTVAQAGGEADGQRYLSQSMIHGSKTGVQGEADLQIGLGYDRTTEDQRYLTLLKNKLPGSTSTIPALKHSSHTVKFSGATGRFSD